MLIIDDHQIYLIICFHIYLILLKITAVYQYFNIVNVIKNKSNLKTNKAIPDEPICMHVSLVLLIISVNFATSIFVLT